VGSGFRTTSRNRVQSRTTSTFGGLFGPPPRARVRLIAGLRGQVTISLAAAALRPDVEELLVDAAELEGGESGFFLPSFLRAGGLAAMSETCHSGQCATLPAATCSERLSRAGQSVAGYEGVRRGGIDAYALDGALIPQALSGASDARAVS